MVVSAEHYRAYLSVAHHLVEFQGDLQTPHGVLIEDAGLSADHEGVLLGVADPVVVVAVLAAAVHVDALHGGLVGLHQIFVLAAEADPAEGTVAVVEQHRTHDVLYIGGPYEAVFLIDAVLGDFLDACVVDGLHERVAVVEEVRSARHEGLDGLVVTAQRFVDELAEPCGIAVEQFGALLEAEAHRAVAAFVDCVA